MGKSRILFWAAAVSLVSALPFIGCRRDVVPENTVRVVVFDRGTGDGRTDPADNMWTEWIRDRVREDLGLDVIFEPVPWRDEDQAQAALMATGNPPDLMMTWNSNNVIAWGVEGRLFDMAPYVDTYLVDVRDFLGRDPALPGGDLVSRNRNRQTGQLFSVPMRRANTARLNVFMRQDWLDALGLPVPATHDEFFDTLVAFRDHNPGRVNRVIPWIMGRDVRWQAGTILESFIDRNVSETDRWVYTVADRHLLVPGYVEGVRFMNRMFNARLVDMDFPLYADDSIPNYLIASGVVGAFGHNWDQVFRPAEGLTTNLRMNVPNARWVAVDAFPSPADGVTHRISHDTAGLSVFIPGTAGNPYGAMRYLNWLARFENFNFLQIGPEGIVHEMVDGLPRVNPAAGDGWIQNSPRNMDLTPLHYGIFLRTPGETARMSAVDFPFPAEDVMRAYDVAMSNAGPDPAVAAAGPLLAVGPVALTLRQQAESLLIQAIMTSEGNFDNVWNAGIMNWMNSGARAVIGERAANVVVP
ncbi:MAG: extracellular solute-binding protein [Treponema sp.]|nr:extracellular solute-binding protein [Treponema sp.]